MVAKFLPIVYVETISPGLFGYIGLWQNGIMEIKRILVVCTSRDGTTRNLGEAIARTLVCPFEEIIDLRKWSGLCGFLIAGMDAARAKLTQIGPPRQDPTQFDLLIVGTPVWDGRMAPAVRTYLKRFQGRLPNLAFYCTAGGSNSKKTLEELSAFTGKQPLALLSLRRSAVRSGDYRVALMKFADRIRSS